MKKFGTALTIAALSAQLFAPLAIAAEDFSVIMITDSGGIDDKSFNQSAWEGLQAFGEKNGLEKGVDGYDYLQSTSDSDFVTNLNSAITSGFDLTVGIGFKLEAAINDVAQQYPDKHFAIVDSVVDQPNVASLTFKEHEAAFLAGVAAALTTKTNKVGFVGGVEGSIIERFEAGFTAGVKAVNPEIEVLVEYAGGFADAPKGKQLAAALYGNDADVIYHAAGGTGNGVFSEAKDIVANDPERQVWVIGADLDQDAEGVVEAGGEERHLTLTSTLKGVGEAVNQFAQATKDGEFQAGVKVFGLADGGVDVTRGQIAEDAWKTVTEYKEKIIKGEITVPDKK